MYAENPFFVGISPGVQYNRDEAVQSQLLKVGLNTGNLLFTEALHRVLGGRAARWGFEFDPSVVQQEHDCIVIAAANWLSPRTDWEKLSLLLDRVTLPIVVVGLGAQAPSESVRPSLKPGTQRLLNILADRDAHVGVRGPYSEEVCRFYGLKNVVVTGCPSILWHVDRPIQIDIERKESPRIALNTSRGLPDEKLFEAKGETARLNLLLSQLALHHNLDIIAQAELPDIFYALGRGSDDSFKKKLPTYLSRVYEADESTVETYLSNKMQIFFRVSDWVEFIRREIDFVAGSRLHGAVACLLAGKPGILMSHDSRTRETASYMGIPAIASTEIRNADFFDRVAQLVDTKSVNGRMAELYRNFAKFFDKCGLKHRLAAKT